MRPEDHEHDDRCAKCGLNVYDAEEYAFMLSDEIWQHTIVGLDLYDPYVLLCIGCVEAGLERPLTAVDFDWSIPLNFEFEHPRSERLLEARDREAFFGGVLVAVAQVLIRAVRGRIARKHRRVSSHRGTPSSPRSAH